MSKMSFSALLLVVCAASAVYAWQPTKGGKGGKDGKDQNPLAKLSTAISRLAADLMIKLIESNPNSNIVISPTSLYLALAMIYAGSGGDTKVQLASALHVDDFDDDDELFDSIKYLLQALSSTKKEYNLKMANRLYGQEGHGFDDDYRKKIEKYFSSQLEEVDFSGDPSGSRSKINNWVARMTSDKIKNLFPASSITSDTHIALANAICFNSSWLYKFEKEKTKSQTFTTAANKKVQVPTMKMSADETFNYYKKLDFQILELPHVGRKVSTMIALFNKNATINSPQRRNAMQTSRQEILDNPKKVSVNLQLPKFTLSPNLNLKAVLQAIGIQDLFDAGIADISGIDTAHNLPLNEAMHQSYVVFNEDGNQAAVGTESNVRRKSSSSKTIDFIVDSPFMFMVYETTTKVFLFKGYVANPMKSN